MTRLYFIFIVCALLFAPLVARAEIIAAPRGTSNAALTGAVSNNPADYMTPTSFNMMEPFMNQNMRERLRPSGTSHAPNPTVSFARSATGSGITPASAYVPAIGGAGRAAAPRAAPGQRQQQQAAGPQPTATQQRRVVQRPQLRQGSVGQAGGQQNIARSATAPQTSATPSIARSAAVPGVPPAVQGGDDRRVIPRSANRVNASRSGQPQILPVPTPGIQMTAEQCLAGYMECMDGYCRRPNTAHNRCFCSARLAQIDTQYRPLIDEAVRNLVIAQHGGGLGLAEQMTDAEVNAYWEATFGAAGQGNSMANLYQAINSINFSDFENYARGQNAFLMGHDFCMQHLPHCFFAAQNMIGVYRSTITRDCNAYEMQLRRTLAVAEAMLTQMSGAD